MLSARNRTIHIAVICVLSNEIDAAGCTEDTPFAPEALAKPLSQLLHVHAEQHTLWNKKIAGRDSEARARQFAGNGS